MRVSTVETCTDSHLHVEQELRYRRVWENDGNRYESTLAVTTATVFALVTITETTARTMT